MRPTTTLLLVVALVAPAPALAAGGSSGGSASTVTVPEQTPEQLAIDYYNRGLKLRDKAWELEEKAAAGGGKAEKLAAKAEKTWEKAVAAFRESIDNNPLLHQAHGSLGYAYRKLGRFEDSLGAYDRSLEIAPNYVEAIEYRAEAYLGLNRLEEAKEAYMSLFRLDREQADTLMTAMRDWIDSNRTGSAVDEALVDEFASWVEERSEIASQTAMLTQAQGRAW